MGCSRWDRKPLEGCVLYSQFFQLKAYGSQSRALGSLAGQDVLAEKFQGIVTFLVLLSHQKLLTVILLWQPCTKVWLMFCMLAISFINNDGIDSRSLKHNKIWGESLLRNRLKPLQEELLLEARIEMDSKCVVPSHLKLASTKLVSTILGRASAARADPGCSEYVCVEIQDCID